MAVRFVRDRCYSKNLMDERRGRVVCRLHKGGDLEKEINESTDVVVYMTRRVCGLSAIGDNGGIVKSNAVGRRSEQSVQKAATAQIKF